ncbi:MAG TPA: calcium-binding protein [Thermoleophilaceae bacterium]|nr:calcium-binding protein [Thermoleophilaceae bacterium]
MRPALTLAAIALVLPASSPASTARLMQTDQYVAGVSYTAADGEVNDVEVKRAGDAVVVTDPGAVINGSDGCAPSGPHAVTCTSTLHIDEVYATLGDRDDSLAVGELVLYAKGGSGADELTASSRFFAELKGGRGGDVLTGGDGGDVVAGGPGPDRIAGRGGADSLSGGGDGDAIDGGENGDFPSGGDFVSYGDHRAPVTVDLSRPGSPAGAAGEGDSVTGVEEVGGGPRDDRLIAAPGGSNIYGGPGGDVVLGGPGPDVLAAGEGDDVVEGRAGADDVAGDAGRDRIRAGAGDDVVDSGDGLDEDDRRGYQKDEVECGAGRDAVMPRDPGVRIQPMLDAIDFDCESVGIGSHLIRIDAFRTQAALRSLSGRLWCVAPQRCRVRITLRLGHELAGTAERELPDNTRRRLAVPLGDEARAQFEATGVLRLHVAIAVRWGRALRRHHETSYTLVLRRSSVSSRAGRLPRARRR